MQPTSTFLQPTLGSQQLSITSQDYSNASKQMIQTKRSVAEDLIQPVKLSFTDEPRKLYVGRLPKGTTDDHIEKLLRLCGDLKSWKRSKDASGEPKAFGFAEFDNLEAVFAVLKLLNNAALTIDSVTSRLLVKADEKTTTFLQGWVEIKKSEWIAKLEKLGVSVDIEDLEQKEALGEI
jgi:RNA recognition motif-containing protein